MVNDHFSEGQKMYTLSVDCVEKMSLSGLSPKKLNLSLWLSLTEKASVHGFFFFFIAHFLTRDLCHSFESKMFSSAGELILLLQSELRGGTGG